ncbi:MAG: VOC family protein, partial [Terriglobales bacterium]
VMVVVFELGGREFLALNGGPMFKFTEAVSFVVNCENQQEIDYYRDKLAADVGKPGQCGWLKGKFGLSWQIVPTAIGRLMSDSKRAPRVMAEVMKMTKLDLKKMAEA